MSFIIIILFKNDQLWWLLRYIFELIFVMLLKFFTAQFFLITIYIILHRNNDKFQRIWKQEKQINNFILCFLSNFLIFYIFIVYIMFCFSSSFLFIKRFSVCNKRFKSHRTKNSHIIVFTNNIITISNNNKQNYTYNEIKWKKYSSLCKMICDRQNTFRLMFKQKLRNVVLLSLSGYTSINLLHSRVDHRRSVSNKNED